VSGIVRRFLRVRQGRAGLLLLGLLGATALLADFLAADLPLFLRYRGESFLFPNLTGPAALRGLGPGALPSGGADVALVGIGAPIMLAPPADHARSNDGESSRMRSSLLGDGAAAGRWLGEAHRRGADRRDGHELHAEER
jgi:hypothetical protein